MLAKFENGNFLEVLVDTEKGDELYFFTVYDEDGDDIDDGWTEYRDIEMYYPKNWIDYILEFCEPYGVEGKYKILEFKTMEEYLPSENTKGKWILETQGDDDEIRRYSTFENAQRVMKKEYEEILENKSPCMDNYLDDDCAEIGDEEYFQSWVIYEEKDNLTELEKAFQEIELQFDRIYTGVSQYAYELQDTSVITDHVGTLKEMIEELKGIIK